MRNGRSLLQFYYLDFEMRIFKQSVEYIYINYDWLISLLINDLVYTYTKDRCHPLVG